MSQLTVNQTGDGPAILCRAIPIIRIFDRAKAVECYVDWLGFRINFEHQFEPNTPSYISITLNGMELHLSEHHGDASPGSRTLVEYPGIHEYHKTLMAKGYKYMRPGVEKAFWGAWEMAVIDPFHNRLTFFERIPE